MTSWKGKDVIAVLGAAALLTCFVFLVILAGLRGGLSHAWDAGLGAFGAVLGAFLVLYLKNGRNGTHSPGVAGGNPPGSAQPPPPQLPTLPGRTYGE